MNVWTFVIKFVNLIVYTIHPNVDFIIKGNPSQKKKIVISTQILTLSILPLSKYHIHAAQQHLSTFYNIYFISWLGMPLFILHFLSKKPFFNAFTGENHTCYTSN